MKNNNYLLFKNRKDFYDFMKENHDKLNEIFLEVKIGDPKKIKGVISYLDAVEVALCFGWIDSTKKSIRNKLIQRFSKRKKNSPFSELNKERCKRLIKLNEMNKDTLKNLPPLDDFKFPKVIMNKIMRDEEAYKFFLSTPPLYQRIRIYNIYFYYKKDKKIYTKSLNNLIKNCKEHKIYGNYDDYGRLSSY